MIMTHCTNEGTLRAYLDQELPVAARDAVADHLAQCVMCRERLDDLRLQTERVGAILSAGSAGEVPDPHHALHKLKQAAGYAERDEPSSRRASSAAPVWRTYMQTSFWTKKVAIGLAVVVVLVGLLALPPVRALADQLLQVFRLQKVVFVPVSSERMEELDNLDFDGQTLFVSEPEMIKEPGDPQTVETIAEAAGMVGYDVYEPTVFSCTPLTTTLNVLDSSAMQFQVNVEGARQMLEMLDIHDVTVPDALGNEPITVEMSPLVAARYACERGSYTLIQGHSPSVSVPDGVDLAEPGRALLRLLGVEPYQADILSKEIDWGSTLVFPFPANLDTIRQVTVNGVDGLLTDGSDWDEDSGHGHRRYRNHNQLYWQQDDMFYVLMGENVGSSDLMEAAESVQ